jgi:hypothetical protein
MEEFRDAFRAHYIPAGMMQKKRQAFMDLKQGGMSVHDYSKQFNTCRSMRRTKWTRVTPDVMKTLMEVITK